MSDFKLTDEEIFNALESAQKTKPVAKPKEKKDNKDVIRFIRKTGLAPGENKVPTYVIYYQFVKWCNPTWTRVWKREEFFRTFKRHFELKRTGRQRYYMINDALNLTDEIYEKAKKYNQKWKNVKRKS